MPWSPLAPGRSSANIRLLGSAIAGVQRNWTLRYHARPVGPQYSSELGNASGSVNGLQYWPAPNWPSSPQAWRSRNVVWPESTPVPNNSNSKMVLSSPRLVGVDVLTPRRLCLTPAKLLWSLPNSPSNVGSLVTRKVSNQSGWIDLKSCPMSSI